jgi:hypothetical protein
MVTDRQLQITEDYIDAQRNLHDESLLEELKDNNEHRVEELVNDPDSDHKSLRWGNGVYTPDDMIPRLMNEHVNKGFIEQYWSDFFRDGQTFQESEAPYLWMIRESGSNLISINYLKQHYDFDINDYLETFCHLNGYEKGRVKIYYVDYGFLGEVVI